MFKKLTFIITLLIISLTLSSCFINNWVSEALNNQSEITDQYHTDTGDSIKLLNNAFNGLTDDLQEYEENSFITNYEIKSNINNMSYNEGNTPSTGKVTALVVPVDFTDTPASYLENGDINPEWESISSFYYKSSYGKLNMSFDIMDWYTCKYESSYYENLDDLYSKYHGEVPGVSAIIDEVMKYYKSRIDLSKYDSNNDKIIDALYIIYSHPIDYNNGDFWWAYQYYTFEEISYNGYYTYPYVFAGFDFLYENDSSCNTHTFIHETAHLFGLEDYYDGDLTSGKKTGGMGGADLMDYTIGDHNAFSKMALGWIDKVYVIENNDSITLTLPALQDSPSAIILCEKFDREKGIFQDSTYYVLEYYTNTNLQEYDSLYDINGVRLLRINASLTNYTDDGYSYRYLRYNNSTTSLNLIDIIRKNGNEFKTKKYSFNSLPSNNNDLFLQGDSSPLIIENGLKRESLFTKFVIDSLNDKQAIITFK